MPHDTVSSSQVPVNSTDYFGLYLDDHASLPSFLCINCLDTTTLDVSQPINYASLLSDRPNANDWHIPNVTMNATTFGGSYDFFEEKVFDAVFNATLQGIYAPNHVVEDFYRGVSSTDAMNVTSMNTTWQGEPVRVWQYDCTKPDWELGASLIFANNASETSWSVQPMCVLFLIDWRSECV